LFHGVLLEDTVIPFDKAELEDEVALAIPFFPRTTILVEEGYENGV
jgi:hypothetical protein